MKSQRNAVFDIAKCLAMYLVVLGHLVADRIGDPAYFINLLHLPVLFFISGFFSVSSVEKRTAGELLKRKTVTLLVPYLLWSGISLAANVALSVLRGGFSAAWTLNEAVQIFVYARSVWFLIQLFITFVIFLAVYKLLEKTGMKKLVVPACLVVWLALSWLVPGDLLAFHKFKWLLPFFLAGYVMGKHREGLSAWLESHKKLSLLGLLSLLYPVLVALWAQNGAMLRDAGLAYASLPDVLGSLLQYAISAVGVVFVMILSRWMAKTPVGKVAAEIGTYSMDIYVIHMFLIKFVPLPVDVKTVNPVVAYGLLAAVTLAMVLVIWLLSKYVLRKIKLYRISIGTN